MKQSRVYNEVSIALITEILHAKTSKRLSWQDLAEGTGLGLADVTAALLGQQPLPEKAAKLIGEKLELHAEMVALLQVIPLSGRLGGVPREPYINRLDVTIQICRCTLKALADEHVAG
ncbi:cyanate hydratase [Pseudomonas petrae]|uniref:Cyanate hydratase n=1 Tax=Pseudomonas petrae TaxID=2912190 RepID=A0ABS9I1H7_9PSED|nr:cyanate hydratase [Pseudomonas petrae]MCF7532492.1 cyanate hydratase [Pseudomonas petrae]MCF7536126.1 cyanate hydratase [Pseudomonas petrae]MCF7541650.1 cyanate hydratase [Pseudomonas petrae]MCF7557494.1 cyanate hydratase [Pseudomonas petrae]